MNSSCLSPLLGLMWLAASPASTDDWPQGKGPQRDGAWRETGLIEKSDTHGSPVKWRVPVNAGYVGPAIADGKVFLLDREAGQPAAHPPGDRSPPMMPGQSECYASTSPRTHHERPPIRLTGSPVPLNGPVAKPSGRSSRTCRT
ncbi:MAG: hypothetical protein M5U12_22975 [Verrucomicrobia bacterium]|nr:hypothetical protein [Verrucomicrobiota bacterium]